jgi:hypothetical protein
MSKLPTPASQAEAEAMAMALCRKFIEDCHPENPEHLGNCLMKLASVAGVMMAHAEGSDRAFDRLVGTAHFVRNSMPREPRQGGTQ